MDHGRRQPPPLRIGDQHGKSRIHDADEGIGRAKINADNFAHSAYSVTREAACCQSGPPSFS